MKNVLILSHDVVGTSMAGPGIRYHEIALGLSEHFNVTLGVFNSEYIAGMPKDLPYASVHVDVHQFHQAFKDNDAIFALWMSADMMNYAKKHRKLMIFDIYIASPIENLVAKISSPGKIQRTDDLEFLDSLNMYKLFLQYGDYFVCSNQRQKDYWLGFLFGSDLISPSSYCQDPIDSRIALMPMGINLAEIPARTPVLRERIQASAEDTILIWTGGIWDWFDATTVIEAMAKLSPRTDIKLVFLGTQHPNKEVPEMAETVLARKLAAQTGLANKTIFFLEGWLPYDERLAYFQDANAAIYAHKSPLEAQFSHRTRMLDHILVGLPTIATRGDYFGEIIERDQLGLVTPKGDALAMADAIVAMTSPQLQKTFRDNILAVREGYSWKNVLLPLIKFLNTASARPATTPIVRPVSTLPAYYKIARRLPSPIKRVLKRLFNR